MRHMLRIDKGCAPMRSEGSSQFDSWIQFVRTYDDCHYIHTVPPKKQQKQVKQKLGTLKTRVVRINVARATLMMQ